MSIVSRLQAVGMQTVFNVVYCRQRQKPVYNDATMQNSTDVLQEKYAALLIKTALNVQQGQCLRIGAELAHRDFVLLLTNEAYKAGARYVHVDWDSGLLKASRASYGQADDLSYLPEYEVVRHTQMADEVWCRLALTGSEFPHIFDDVAPDKLRTISETRYQRLHYYVDAQMVNRFQWTVAGVPTEAWARQVFPGQSESEALKQLWALVLKSSRVDHADPVTAWDIHADRLQTAANFMHENRVQELHYFDPTSASDGKPSTDLTIGLPANALWLGGASTTQDGVRFFPNMPTEEIFSAPHSGKATGWTRLSKPATPFDKEVHGGWFQFEDGQVVDFGADSGMDVLEQFFDIPGTRRLGEVALVDVRSPINQAGVLFHDILFDENAACHIAFGSSYGECIEGGNQMSKEELEAAGLNQSLAHLDMMIGTSTMDITGVCADGSKVAIMKQGQFTSEIGGE